MTITRIERQRRNPERYNIFLDGEFAFGLHKETLARYALRKGDELTAERIREITGAEELTLAKQKALRLLSYRMRTEHELRTRLLEKEFPPPVIDSVIEQFRNLGLINDLEFARAFLRDAELRKPVGWRRLQQKLRQRGVPPAIIAEALAAAGQQDRDEEQALKAAQAQMRRFKPARQKVDRLKQQQRLAQFLARRGFSWSTIRPVLKQVFKVDIPPDDAE